MPIFEYVCKKCGKNFETLVPNASAKPACPACGEKGKVARKLSKFAAAVKQEGCPSQAFCPSAQSGGCGCGHAGCGHHH